MSVYSGDGLRTISHFHCTKQIDGAVCWLYVDIEGNLTLSILPIASRAEQEIRT